MITNTGRNILAKYLIGQTPSYASHIAVGCGARPLNNGVPFEDYSDQEALEFEMFRVPITSRGYVSENGTPNIVFTAELPTAERYEITEVGVFSAASNQLAGPYDSKTLFGFGQNENWEHHTISPAAAAPLQTILEPLDNTDNPDNEITKPGTLQAFQTNADNRIFTNLDRVQRYEQSRFLNNIVMVRGDDSNLSIDENSGSMIIEDAWEEGAVTKYSNHIHLAGTSIDFDGNSGNDQLKLGFSIVNKKGYNVDTVTTVSNPTRARILVEFVSTESQTNPSLVDRAAWEIELEDGQDGVSFAENRYFVETIRIQDLVKSINFVWNRVTVVKVSVSVFEIKSVDGDLLELPSDQYYVALDAIRLENVTTSNPLYGLTGYSVIRSSGAYPITKLANTSNLIEFRFAITLDAPFAPEEPEGPYDSGPYSSVFYDSEIIS
jgi:hypothetical protein